MLSEKKRSGRTLKLGSGSWNVAFFLCAGRWDRIARMKKKGTERTLAFLTLFSVAAFLTFSTTTPSLAAKGSKSGFDNVPEFGGPSSVGTELKEDDSVKSQFLGFANIMDPYNVIKKDLNQKYGLAFSLDYTAMYLRTDESAGEDEAGGGISRFYGSWTLLGRDSGNTGTLVYKVENRHEMGTDIPPKGLGFSSGYAGFYAPIYSDYDTGLTNLYWQQKLRDGRLNFVAGVVDVTDYLDVYGMINPWTSFSNLAFLTNPSIPAPNQGIGAAFGMLATDNIYLVAGMADTNGDPSEPGDMADSFFDEKEYFYHLEVGWFSSFDRRYFDNLHLTFWQVDEREQALTPDGWGAAFSYTTFINDKFMPFLRIGYADDGGALYEKNVSIGLGRYWPETKNLLGIGINWSRPDEGSFGPGLDDQYSNELFYRWQLTQNLALTPDLQLIIDPALHNTEDSIFVYGLRLRIVL
jgi:porin